MKYPFWVGLLVWTLLTVLIYGCASRAPIYNPVPAWLIPTKPTVPTVMAADLMCLSDDAYTRLAERDRACWQYARELRALLGDSIE